VPKYTDPKKAEKIMRAAGVIPLEPFKGSGVKWKCQCKKCKSIVYPAYNSVNSQKTNPCRKCAALEMGARRRKKVEKVNIAIMKKAFLFPLESFPGNSKPWLSKCMKCKKKVNPHLSSVKNGSACAYCAGVKVDEADVRAFYKKAGYLPIGNYPGAKKKWKAKHKPCGKVVFPEYSKVKQGRGCAVCSGNAKIYDTEAKKLFLKNHLKPLVPFVNSQEPWKSECLKCGKTVSPKYTKVKSRGHQCGYCAGSKVDEIDAIALVKSNGFTPLKPYPGGNIKWLSVC
jgi:DNA-directed RNA polymerase subunit RPC12/RpoP